MQFKKIIPLALALSISAIPSASATNIITDADSAPTATSSAPKTDLIERVCNYFEIPFCPPSAQAPDAHPEEKPDTPPQLPDVVPPAQKPDQETNPQPDGGNKPVQESMAVKVLSLVNAERVKAGLTPLMLDATVQKAAQIRAQESARSFSHTRPNGSSFSTALTEAGVNYRGAGENIAYGQSTPQEVMHKWMNSPGHRANIMSKNFTTIGIGYTVVNGTPYWAQLFTY